MPANPFSDLFAPEAPIEASPTAMAPRAMPPATMPDFGDSAATPPFVPSAPAFRPPAFDINQPRAQGPSFMSGALPLLAAVIAGGKHPAAIGAGLAAYLQGKRLREAERMDATELARKRQGESAEFYSRALGQAQLIDDPITFEQWKEAIAPVAQLHGIDPRAFVFNDRKRAEKAQREAEALLSALDKEHPDGVYSVPVSRLERITGKKYEGPAANGVVPRSVLARIGGREAVDARGQALNPATSKPSSTVGNSRILSDVPLDRQHAAAVASHDQELAQQIEEAMRRQDATKRDPVNPVLAEIQRLRLDQLRNAPLTPAQETAARGLADDFDKNTKDYQIRLDALLSMREVEKNPSAAGDIALVFAFMKLQDPNSAVRETEYANAQNAAGVPERIRNLWNKVKDGQFLTPEQRRDFLTQSRNIFRGARSKYQITRQSYETRARARGIDPKLVITDYDALLGPEEQTQLGTGNKPPSRIKSITPIS